MSRKTRTCARQLLAEVANLVREADALYASHHYNVYHFLLTLSDVAGGEGLEHGQSSDNGVGEKGFADDAHQLRNRTCCRTSSRIPGTASTGGLPVCISRTSQRRSRATCCGFTRA